MKKKKKSKNKNKRNQSSKLQINAKPLISICMIVKNEEKDLPECLRSVQKIADELIIVDTGSVDKTAQIATKFGAKVYYFSWCDDFSAARNESLIHATGKWIIWLDADDRIEEKYHNEIKKLAQSQNDRGFYFILQNHGFENSKALQLRMFPNNPKLRFTRPIHEQIATSLDEQGYSCVKTDVVVKHTGYSSPEVVKNKKKHYMKLMEAWLENNPNDPLIRYQYALALHTLEQHEPAITAIKLLINFYENRPKTDPIYFYSLLLLGRSYLNLKQFDLALKSFENGLKLHPDSSFLLISIAEVYSSLKNYEDAYHYLQKASDEPDKSLSFFPIDYSILKGGRSALLGKVLTELNRFQEAYHHLVNAIDILPNRPEGHKYLAEWYYKNGDYEQAIKEFQNAAQNDKNKIYYFFKIGEIYLQLNELQKAKLFFEKIEEDQTVLPVLWLNLALIERGCGRFKEALKYLKKSIEYNQFIDEINLQISLTYFDKGDIQSSLRFIENYSQIDLKKWFSNLLFLENGNNEQFTKNFILDNPELNGKDNDEIVQYLFYCAETAENSNQYIKTEVIFRIIMFLDQSNRNNILTNLANVQIKNHRIFQAISTLEQKINYCIDRNELVENLKIIGKCYLQMGVVQAYQICNQKIQQLLSLSNKSAQVLVEQ